MYGSPVPISRQYSHALALQQQHPRRRAAPGGHHRRARVADLPLTRIPPQLRHRLVQETEPVRAALRELAAVGVHWQLAVEGDAAPAVDPVRGTADLAEPERFEPRDGVEREPVVQ